MWCGRNLDYIQLKSENTEYTPVYFYMHLISMPQNKGHFCSVRILKQWCFSWQK